MHWPKVWSETVADSARLVTLDEETLGRALETFNSEYTGGLPFSESDGRLAVNALREAARALLAAGLIERAGFKSFAGANGRRQYAPAYRVVKGKKGGGA